MTEDIFSRIDRLLDIVVRDVEREIQRVKDSGNTNTHDIVEINKLLILWKERLTNLTEAVKNETLELKKLRRDIKDFYVTKEDFAIVKRLVFGATSVILTLFMTGVALLVWKK